MTTNRSKTIQARLTQKEYERFQINLQRAGMDQSTYLRQMIANDEVHTVDHAREIMGHICNLFTLLNQQEMDGYGIVMEELNQICRLLR